MKTLEQKISKKFNHEMSKNTKFYQLQNEGEWAVNFDVNPKYCENISYGVHLISDGVGVCVGSIKKQGNEYFV